ncbi:MAG: AsmA family protein, partial [Bacteroidota bacterium]
MKKFFRRLLLFLFAIVLLVVIGAVVIVSFFEEQVGKTLVKEINKQLTTELVVEKFDLSVLPNFPNVAANLRNISLKDNRSDTLLQAENLSFRFGLLSLLSRSIKVKKVVVNNGALNIYVDARGKNNYTIFKSDP